MRAFERTARMYAMARLRIAELLANAPIDPEAHLDAARVERYARTARRPSCQRRAHRIHGRYKRTIADLP